MNNRSIIIANSVLAISFLMSAVCVFGMEKELDLANRFLQLPQDAFVEIVHTKQPLNDFIQTTLSLKNSCKYCNAILSLDWLKKASKDYSQQEKDKVMEELLRSINDGTYWDRRNRRKAIALTYLGADNQAYTYYSLLKQAIHRKDKHMIFVLFKNNVNPNQKSSWEEPDFFNIKDVDILKMFIEQGLEVNAEYNDSDPNVLWWVLYQHPYSELIEKYLESKVDVRKKDKNNSCILHKLVWYSYAFNMNRERYIKIGELLCNAAPDMINMKNNNGEKPLQSLHKRLKENWSSSEKEKLLALIPVFEKCEKLQKQQRISTLI